MPVVSEGKVDVLHQCLESISETSRRLKVNDRDKVTGASLVHQAVRVKNSAVLDMLLSHGADGAEYFRNKRVACSQLRMQVGRSRWARATSCSTPISSLIFFALRPPLPEAASGRREIRASTNVDYSSLHNVEQALISEWIRSSNHVRNHQKHRVRRCGHLDHPIQHARSRDCYTH
ncbi:transient receptor potential cation channel subfamily A member 1 homolog [Ixodes scapularis]